MTITDALFECIESIIESAIIPYDDALLEIAEDKDVVELVACNLKIINRRSYYNPSKEELKKIDAIDWKKEAKKYIIEYLNENYLPESVEC